MRTETCETWISADDRGTQRRFIVYYDRDGIAQVTRQALSDLLTRAGMRQSFDVADPCQSTSDGWCATHSDGTGPAYCQEESA